MRILSDRQKEFSGPDSMIINPVTVAVRKAWSSETGVHTSLPPQIKADLPKIINKLKAAAILNAKGQYSSKPQLLIAEDDDIIRYYVRLARGLLAYYRCADNIKYIKDLVMHRIRFSLLTTLRVKHKLNKNDANLKYGDPITCMDYKRKMVSFLTNMEIYNLKK